MWAIAHTPSYNKSYADSLSISVLKTGLTPSASGSAYLEVKREHPYTTSGGLIPRPPGLKLTCAVHGPRPLPRSAPFSPQLLLSAKVKFTPFANGHGRGFIPDSDERDLAAHLETALKGTLLAERWPKSGVDVVITVLEGEEGSPSSSSNGTCDHLNLLSSCITVASAAIADAGIDCVDLAAGGVAAIVPGPSGRSQLILDPCPSDHQSVGRACVVAYLQARDELTEVWAKQEGGPCGADGSEHLEFLSLVDGAVEAAKAARLVLMDTLNESVEAKLRRD